jgi:hypothetical protein
VEKSAFGGQIKLENASLAAERTSCVLHKMQRTGCASMRNNENSASADVRLRLEGRVLEFIESQRRRQVKIPPRIEIVRQLIEKAINSSEDKVA